MPRITGRDAEIQQRRRERLAAEGTAAAAAARKRRHRRVVYGLLVAVAIAAGAVGIVLGAGVIVAAAVGLIAMAAIAGWSGRKPNQPEERASAANRYWGG